MHELSIAQSLIDLARAHLVRSGITDPDHTRVTCVHVRIGLLSAVVPEALRTAFNQARIRTPLETATLQIELVPTTVWCAACQAEKKPTDPRRLRCPDCGQHTPTMRAGLELELTSMEFIEANEESSHAAHA